MKTVMLSMAALGLAVPAAPVLATTPGWTSSQDWQMSSEYKKKKKHKRKHQRYDRGDRYESEDRAYSQGYREGRRDAQRINADTRVWRGDDGRYYCKRDDGTTGLLIGGAVGGLIGNEVAGRGDKLIGTILGAAGGAIIGRAIDRSDRDRYSCR